MNFVYADTFRKSLEKLQAAERSQIIETAFEFMANPSLPSMHFHRLNDTKDPNFWSARADQDLRLRQSCDLELAPR